jgi:hypothetical protein
MGGYGGHGGPRMVEVRVPEMDMYMARQQQQQLDGDGEDSSLGGDDKEKGRGSYKCGRVSENVWACVCVAQVLFYSGRETHIEIVLDNNAVRSTQEGSCMSVPAKTKTTSRRASSRASKRSDSSRNG